ncbi:flippase-like domain-containing protein [Candidatus Woesearchaeota archaeon]|nr:flippase-like domain-containing protein [Candidatus Woesearchaeota archaeon]
MNLNKLRYVVLFIGLAIIGYILWQIDYGMIRQIKIDWSFFKFLLLFLIILMIFIVRTWRWQLFLKSINVCLKFIPTLLLVAPSMAFALFSPAQSGDLIKIEFLKKKFGVPRKESFSTVAMEKILDLGFLFTFFVIGISHISIAFLKIDIMYILAFIIISILLGISLIWLLRNRSNLIRITLMNFKLIFKSPVNFLLGIFMTILYWGFLAWAWLLVAKILNIPLTFVFTIEILSILSVIGLITLIPGGLGVVEISAIIILSNILNINSNIAAVYSIFMRLYTVFIAIIGYLPFLLDIQKVFKSDKIIKYSKGRTI